MCVPVNACMHVCWCMHVCMETKGQPLVSFLRLARFSFLAGFLAGVAWNLPRKLGWVARKVQGPPFAISPDL